MKKTKGFTLLELLVVLVIMGLMLGLVTFSMVPSDYSVLQNDAQRIALLLEAARDEAIVRNRPIAFDANTNSYRFLIRENSKWLPINDDKLLRERNFVRPPVHLNLAPPPFSDDANLRIVFGREPVDRPFLLTLAIGSVSVSIHADGIGHFEVRS